MSIRNNFQVLLAEKAQSEGRRISLLEVEQSTGITRSTLASWATNQVARFDAPVIDKLMGYFGRTQISDLLIYTPAADESQDEISPSLLERRAGEMKDALRSLNAVHTEERRRLMDDLVNGE